jgi:hypothetical protein
MSRDFRWLLVGQTTSQFGAQISGVAIPLLAVLNLGATPFELGPVTASSTVAFALIGLPASAWVDRCRRRRILVVSDFVRAVRDRVRGELHLHGAHAASDAADGRDRAGGGLGDGDAWGGADSTAGPAVRFSTDHVARTCRDRADRVARSAGSAGLVCFAAGGRPRGGEFGQIVYAITNVTLRQRLVPAQLLGRVNATMRFLLMGLFPLGALIGGAFGSLIGPRLTLVVSAGLIAVSWLPVYYGNPIPGAFPAGDLQSKEERGTS